MANGQTSIYALGLVILATLATIPFIAGPYALFFCGQMLCLGYIAASLQLSFAYARVLSFAQGMFFATAAYVACTLHNAGYGMLVTLAGAVLAAGAFGLLVGLLVTRMKGAHTAVIGTLLVASILLMSANTFVDITGGEDGLSLKGPTHLFGLTIPLGTNPATYFAAFIPLGGYLVLTAFAERTTFGLVLKAAGSNEARARQLGYDVQCRHLVVFGVAAGISGYGGAISALMLQHISSSLFDPAMSLTAVLWATVGGLRMPLGALFGTVVIFPLTELASRLFNSVEAVVGLLLIIIAIAFPQGIVGALDRRFLPAMGLTGRLRAMLNL